MVKNAFYFTLKNIFKFLSWIFDYVVEKLISKFVNVTTWLTNNSIHTLLNISRSKGNQTMKFDQLVDEQNEQHCFLKNHTKMLWRNYSETVLSKIKIEHSSWLMVQSFTQFILIVCQVTDYLNILKLSCRLLAFTSYKTFLKNKKSVTLLALFSAQFLKNNISHVILYQLTKFNCLVAFTSRDIGQLVRVQL